MRGNVLAAIFRYHMLSQGDTVTVAFSGGADSTAMLHLLATNAQELAITVRAAHVNHNLRGEESNHDEAFVRGLCKQLGIELEVLPLHGIVNLARAKGMGVEEYARRERYAFFARLHALYGGKIATAHTASDSLETTLFHLARGTGLRGLRGIPPVRGEIIRPLINCTRTEVEAYCAENNLSYVTDSTNASCDYARNRIRMMVVPALCAVHEGLEQSYPRLREWLSQDDDYLWAQARLALANSLCDGGWKTAELAELHPALRFRVLSLIAQGAGAVLNTAKAIPLTEGLLTEGFALELTRGCVLEVRRGVLRYREQPTTELLPFQIPVDEGRYPLPSGHFAVLSIRNYENYKHLEKFAEKSLKNALDYDRIQKGLILRTRCSGDSIRLNGRGVTKTLKKLFCETAVLPLLRSQLAVLADDAGVVWVEGFGCAERVAVSNGTKRVLNITIAEE